MYKYDINTVLYTKDGRWLGNALIVRYAQGPYSKPTYVIKTDYGNELSMTAEQIESTFYVSSICSASHKHHQSTFHTKETLDASTSTDSKQAEACKADLGEEFSWAKLPCIKIYDIVQGERYFRLTRNYHMTPDLSLSAIKTKYRRRLVSNADANRERRCYSTSFATDVRVLDVPDEDTTKLIQYTLHSLTLIPYKAEHGEVRLKGRWTTYPVKRFAGYSIVTSDASLSGVLPICTIAQ